MNRYTVVQLPDGRWAVEREGHTMACGSKERAEEFAAVWNAAAGRCESSAGVDRIRK
jgi:hypothetical protein